MTKLTKTIDKVLIKTFLENISDQTFTVVFWDKEIYNYLNSCAAAFHYAKVDVHQILLSKEANNQLPRTRHYMYEMSGNKFVDQQKFEDQINKIDL